MRILQIIANTDPKSGGPVEAVRGLTQMLIRLGHSVEVATLEPEEVAAQRSFPIRVTGLGAGFGSRRINLNLIRWLRKRVDDYDVVILHGLWNYSSVGAWLALKHHRTPYFIFAHGMLASWFRTNYPAKHIAKQIYWWLFEGRVLRDAQAVLFTCEGERVDARNAFRGHGYRERVVQFGTAAPSGDPVQQKAEFYATFPWLAQRRLLLFLSRIHPKKGCDLLIKAYAQCAAQLPPDLDLMIAGPDEVGYVPKLKALAETLGVAQRIHWPGMLTGDVKWGALRCGEAMILPSHQENFGFVVPEAMAVSSPVLISDKVNIWREVETCGAGFVEPDTEQGTRNLIRRFYSLSAEERMRMSLAAGAGFRTYFDIQVTSLDFARAIGAMQDGPRELTLNPSI